MKSDKCHKRQVTKQEVLSQAGVLGFGYCEASVYDLTDFEQVFHCAVMEVIELKADTCIEADGGVIRISTASRIHRYHHRSCCN